MPVTVERHARQSERPALRVKDLVAQRLDGVSFDVKFGEIVGVAGLTGSGREELAGALVGERVARVEIENVDGRRRSNPNPRQAKELGVVLVLPNRSAGAAVAEFSVQENISLPSLSRDATFGMISHSAEVAHSSKWIEALDIRPRDPERPYSFLSGGNQQKVIFGKWLGFTPKVMVIEDPTSGVDVGARKAIYELIRDQASSGVSFIVCSSDSDDLLAVCDRILVLNEGHIVEQLEGDDINESRLLLAMSGSQTEVVAAD
jgi:ribose transport system ATP-binding protein